MPVHGQNPTNEDSLRRVIRTQTTDTLRSRAYNELAQMYRKRNLDSAFAFLDTERAILGRYDSAAVAHLWGGHYYRLGIMHTERGEYLRSDSSFALAEAFYTRAGRDYDRAVLWGSMAINFIEKADFVRAIELNLRVLAYHDSAGNTYEKTRIHNNIGYVYERLGDYAAAIHHLNQSRNLAEQNGYDNLLSLTVYNFANVFRDLGRLAEAKTFYCRAIGMLQQLEQPGYEGLAWRDLGAAYLLEDSLAAADSSIRRSIVLFRRIGNLPELTAAELALGKLLVKRGDFATAQVQLAEAYSLAVTGGQPHLRSAARLAQAQLAFQQGQLGLAETYLNDAQAIVDSIGLMPQLVSILDLRSEIAYARGRYREAYDLKGRYSTLNDSLKSDQLQLQLSQLQGSYALARKDAEIERLAQQNEIVRLSASRTRARVAFIILAVLLVGGGGFWWQRARYRRRAEAQLLALAQAAPVPLAIINQRSHAITYASDRLALFFGTTPSEIEGKPAARYLGGAQTFEGLAKAWQKSGLHGQQHELALEVAGATVWVILVAERTNLKNEEVWVVGVLDITPRRQAEAALRESKEAAENAYAELQSARAQLALREKLSALGELVAGIAHELNSPLGVIHSSAQLLSDALPRLLRQWAEMERTLPPTLRPAMDELLSQLQSPTQLADSRSERQYRKQLTESLTQIGLPNASDTARLLVEAGMVASTRALEELLLSPVREQILSLIHQVGLALTNVSNTRLAAGKTSALVKALKRYTHTSAPDGGVGVINLRDNLHTILLLYTYSIRQQADLEVQLQEDVYVQADPDKLGQIWTNLITNALHAISGRGALRIGLSVENGRACVKVADNGAGIPPEVLPRIFDPFFTTKQKGEGTGMGLHIARQLLEGYGGTIEVRSQPGETVFSVWLPLVQPLSQTPNAVPASSRTNA